MSKFLMAQVASERESKIEFVERLGRKLREAVITKEHIFIDSTYHFSLNMPQCVICGEFAMWTTKYDNCSDVLRDRISLYQRHMRRPHGT